MAGHSKWANIKCRKERADQLKGKAFTRITKEIITAVKLGGVDPQTNSRLRLALLKARALNLPKDNIDRLLKRACAADQADFAVVIYEIYGHGGVGIIVEANTDNKNRTAADIRIAIQKKGGMQGTPGSVLFNFEQVGMITIPIEGSSEDSLFLLVTQLGALDMELSDDSFLIVTEPQLLMATKDSIEKEGFVVVDAVLERMPKQQRYVECEPEAFAANQGLISFLEQLDDVETVYHNMKGNGV